MWEFAGASVTYLVQHHVTDGWEPLRLLYAGGHELEAQQEVPVVLTLPTGLRQVWSTEEKEKVETSKYSRFKHWQLQKAEERMLQFH